MMVISILSSSILTFDRLTAHPRTQWRMVFYGIGMRNAEKYTVK